MISTVTSNGTLRISVLLHDKFSIRSVGSFPQDEAKLRSQEGRDPCADLGATLLSLVAMISYSKLFRTLLRPSPRDPAERPLMMTFLLDVPLASTPLCVKYIATCRRYSLQTRLRRADRLLCITLALEDLKRELHVSISFPSCISYSTGDVNVQWKTPKDSRT
jgi:hypothetical protein